MPLRWEGEAGQAPSGSPCYLFASCGEESHHYLCKVPLRELDVGNKDDSDCSHLPEPQGRRAGGLQCVWHSGV